MSHDVFTNGLLGTGREGGGLNGGGIGQVLIDIGGEIIEEIFGNPGFPDFPGLPTAKPKNGNGAMFEVGACGAKAGRTQAAFINGAPCCPTGFHFSKTSGCCIRNRKMNVLNMRAHSRATRRIKGTARAMKRARKAVGDAAREMDACPKPSRRRRSQPCK